MSKWINKDAFASFQQEKKLEAEQPAQTFGIDRREAVWPTPEKGTADRAKVYTLRFLPDKKGNFYKKYHYHMFMSGEKWVFLLCPKTHDFENYCPWCSVTSKLYMGSAADKQAAYNYKRKDKYVGNVFIVDDPRDAEREDKMNGTVKLYEFPAKVEMKLKEEITDVRNGLGRSIFDPGEDGYDFILKVLSTKKDDRGRQWPDYSNSAFSRRPTAIADTDREIEEIMVKTKDLGEYVKSLERDNDYIRQTLKDEMVYDLVEKEWNKVLNIQEKATASSDEPDDIDDSRWAEQENLSGDTDEPDEFDQEQDSDGDDLSDEALLQELSNL